MVFAHRRVDGLSGIAETRRVAARGIAGGVMVSLSCGVFMCASVAAAGPRFSAPVFRPTGTDVWDFVAADLDADGNPDVVTINGEESELSVLRGRGDGTFLPPLTYQSPGEPYARLAVVDVNADGRPDLIITSFNEGAEKSYVDVLLNDGAGHFRRHGRYTTRGELHDGVAAGDVNGDGIVDLVAAVEVFSDAPNSRPQLFVLVGTGAGRFAARGFTGRGAFAVAVGDLNGDSKLDVVLTTVEPAALSLRLGNGDGTFGPGRALGPRNVDDIELADLNHDGKLDVVLAGGYPRHDLRVALGNGDGTLRDVSRYPGWVVPPIAIADFDLDDNADIATLVWLPRLLDPDRIVVRSGRSDGTRGTVQSLRWRGFFDRGLRVSDFNRDGWIDVVAVGNSPSPGLRILLNWTGLAAPPCVVVPVTRVRARIAERDIKRAGCQLGRVSFRYSSKLRQDRVISQRPRSGAVLPSQTRVHLVISRGRRPRNLAARTQSTSGGRLAHRCPG